MVTADVFLQEADRMIIEKMSVMEADLRKDDIRYYIDENLLQLGKKMDQSHMEVKSALEQQKHEFEKEKNVLMEKIERLEVCSCVCAVASLSTHHTHTAT